MAKLINLASIDTNVEQKLGFKPDANINDGICLGTLIRLELVEKENPKVDDDGNVSTYFYKGITTTSLLLEFQQINTDKSDTHQRFYLHIENPVVGIKSNGDAMTDKVFIDLVTQQFARLQHIVNELDLGLGKKSKDISELTMSLDDSAELLAEKFKKMYVHFFNQISGCVDYKKNKEDFVPRWTKVALWIKLVAEYNSGKRYSFPTFPKKGFIEVVKQGVKTKLAIDANETLELKSGKTSKSMDKPSEQSHSTNVSETPSVDDLLRDIMKQ